MEIVLSGAGRAVVHNGEQIDLPSLPVDATVHVYDTPNGIWAGVQELGTPRPLYPGSGGSLVGNVFLEADLVAVLEVNKALKIKAISRAYEAALNRVLKDYPDIETKTWDKQESEARAWAADNTVPVPLLTAIADARGMTLADLVPRVIAKADAWMQLSGAATGKRQALEEAINVATTLEEVEAIAW